MNKNKKSSRITREESLDDLVSEIDPRGKMNGLRIDGVAADYKKTTINAVQRNSNERDPYASDHQRASAAFQAIQGNQNPFLNRSLEEEGNKRNSFAQYQQKERL